MHKYIKVYHFLLLMKWKGKKGPKRNKVKTENAKMKVIKWERIWDTKRERERERHMILTTTTSQAASYRCRWGKQYLTWYDFLGKTKLDIIFIEWVEQVMNLND